ncbi:hypothetical protein ASZ90_009066 [hydrocarbon metagenome]|uniref:Uncharacterized protein n=1 Tax=hydrocarbon metagenome TaxID=938273 RepID=A0A0W8FK11_9ZZZZ
MDPAPSPKGRSPGRLPAAPESSASLTRTGKRSGSRREKALFPHLGAPDTHPGAYGRGIIPGSAPLHAMQAYFRAVIRPPAVTACGRG